MTKTSKRPTISLVIPVYNEADGLKACLDSIAAQTVMPDEVIVVDNNSTDGSAEVAARYTFVTVLHEKTQGTIAARDRGFDAAAGDIIGRIDADCILKPDWTTQLRQIFKDKSVDAVAGIIETDAFPWRTPLRTTFWSRMYLGISNAYFGVQIMQGGNMAFRRDAWCQIRLDTQTDSYAIHEDQDISILFAAYGRPARQYNKVKVGLPVGSASHSDWPKFKDYLIRWVRLREYHEQAGTFNKPKIILLPFYKLVLMGLIMLLPFVIAITSSILLDSFKRWNEVDPID